MTREEMFKKWPEEWDGETQGRQHTNKSKNGHGLCVFCLINDTFRYFN